MSNLKLKSDTKTESLYSGDLTIITKYEKIMEQVLPEAAPTSDLDRMLADYIQLDIAIKAMEKDKEMLRKHFLLVGNEATENHILSISKCEVVGVLSKADIEKNHGMNFLIENNLLKTSERVTVRVTARK
jgi:hypothetical protein